MVAPLLNSTGETVSKWLVNVPPAAKAVASSSAVPADAMSVSSALTREGMKEKTIAKTIITDKSFLQRIMYISSQKVYFA